MQMSKYKNYQTANWQKAKVDFFIFPLKPSSMLCFSEQYKISCQNILKCMGSDTEYCFPHFNPSRQGRYVGRKIIKSTFAFCQFAVWSFLYLHFCLLPSAFCLPPFAINAAYIYAYWQWGCARDSSKYPVKPPELICLAKLEGMYGGCGVLRRARPAP